MSTPHPALVTLERFSCVASSAFTYTLITSFSRLLTVHYASGVSSSTLTCGTSCSRLVHEREGRSDVRAMS